MDTGLKRKMYMAFVAIGAIVPYAVLLPWLMTHGLDLSRLFREATSSTGAMFFTVDVIVSALVVLWAAAESIAGWRLWTVVGVTLLVGVSAGLPLLLYFQAGVSVPAGGSGNPVSDPAKPAGGPTKPVAGHSMRH